MVDKKKSHKNKDRSRDNFEELDDLDFGEDFDLDKEMADLDGDSRSPSTSSISKETAKAAAREGAKSFGSQLGQTLYKKGLPEEYSVYQYDAMDLVDFSKDVFDRSKEKIRKPISRMAKEAKKILPSNIGILNKLLDTAIGDTEAQQEYDEKQQQESTIAGSLSSIFDKQIEVQKVLEADRQAKEEVNQKVNLQVTKRSSELLADISAQMSTQTGFTLNIAKDYYKKSLELQFRSYYVQAEQLNVTKKYFEAFSVQNDQIVKNTGLPEFVKLKNSERLLDIIKTQTVENLYSEVLNKNTYINTVKKKINRLVDEKVNDFTFMLDNITEGISGITQLEEMGGSKAELSAALGGSFLGDNLGERAGNKIVKKIKNKVSGNKYVQRGKYALSTLGNSPQVALGSLKEYIEKVQSDTEGKSGIVSKGANILSKIFSPVADTFTPEGVNMDMNQDNILTAKTPAIFDQHAHRSITQVIPLYLAKILKQNTITAESLLIKLDNNYATQIRKSIPTLYYDFNTNRLVPKVELQTSYSNFLKARKGESSTKEAVDTIHKTLRDNQLGASVYREDIQGYLSQASTILSPSDMTYENLFSDVKDERIKNLIDSNSKFRDIVTQVKGLQDKKVTPAAMNTLKEAVKKITKTGAENEVIELFNKIARLPAIPEKFNIPISLTDTEATAISMSFTRFIMSTGAVLIPKTNVLRFAFSYVNMPDTDKNANLLKKINLFLGMCKIIEASSNIESKLILTQLFAKVDKVVRETALRLPPDLARAINRLNPQVFEEQADIQGNLKIQTEFTKNFSFGKDQKTEIINDLTAYAGETEAQINEVILDITKDAGMNIFEKLDDKADAIKTKLESLTNSVGLKLANRTIENFKKGSEYLKTVKNNLKSAKTPQEVADVIKGVATDMYKAADDARKKTISKTKEAVESIVSSLDKLTEENKDKIKSTLINQVDKMINSLKEQITVLEKSNELLQEQIPLMAQDFTITQEESEEREKDENISEDKISSAVTQFANLKANINKKGIEQTKKLVERLEKLKEEINNLDGEKLKASNLISTIKQKFTNILNDTKKSLETFKEEVKNEVNKTMNENQT